MEKERKIFCCEDTADGYFTAVYDAWASGFGLSRVTVQAGGTYSRRPVCFLRGEQDGS